MKMGSPLRASSRASRAGIKAAVEWAAGPRKPIRKAHKSLSRDTARSLRARAAAQKEMVCLRQAALCEPEAVLAYLARYTHRVAIANSRLVSLDERGVSFQWPSAVSHNDAQSGRVHQARPEPSGLSLKLMRPEMKLL